MENLIFSLKIVAPIFIIMAMGYILKLTHVLNENTVIQVNKMIFRLLLPLLVFMNIYNGDPLDIIDFNLVLFVIIGTVVQFFIALSIALLSSKNNSHRGVMVQGMFRSNYLLFAIPITVAICGDSAAGMASLLIGVAVPLYNILSVIVLEMFGGGSTNFFKTILGVIKNPLIIAAALAIVLKYFNIVIPGLLLDTLSTVADITTPLAFIMLGAFFTFKDLGKYIKPIAVTLSFKLIIFPAIFIIAAILIGFRGEALVIIMSVFASPIAVGSFTMAQEMKCDGKLAGQLVVTSSLLSIITIFLIIFLLRTYSYV